jgi:hypothetical protein
MRRTITLAMLGLLGAAACGDGISYQNACKKMAVEVCDKAFHCGPDSILSFYLSQYESQAQCTSGERKACETTDTECDPGETYHASKARQCVNEFAALSCNQLDVEFFPDACAEVCTPSSSGSGGSSGSRS